MYERFTDRARKVMQLAAKEAQKLNHNYVDTGHMMLGILAEQSNLACHALAMVVNRDDLRNAFLRAVTRGEELDDSLDPPLTSSARRAVDYAGLKATALGDKHVGPEHLLLGMLKPNSDSIFYTLLLEQGVTPRQVRNEVFRLLGRLQDKCEVTTWGDLLAVLQEQIQVIRDKPIQVALIGPDSDAVVELLPAYALGMIADLEIAACRSVVDNKWHGDDVVLLIDHNPFAEDGAIAYEDFDRGKPIYGKHGKTDPKDQRAPVVQVDEGEPIWRRDVHLVVDALLATPQATADELFRRLSKQLSACEVSAALVAAEDEGLISQQPPSDGRGQIRWSVTGKHRVLYKSTTEGYGPGWRHCTIHLNPETGEMHSDGDHSVRAWIEERIGRAKA